MTYTKPSTTEPYFTRSDVARILNVTPLTVANRERQKKYPTPRRDLNNYRVYSLNDILNLQLISFAALDSRPILSVLYDKGVINPKEASQLIDLALSRRRGLA